MGKGIPKRESKIINKLREIKEREKERERDREREREKERERRAFISCFRIPFPLGVIGVRCEI